MCRKYATELLECRRYWQIIGWQVALAWLGLAFSLIDIGLLLLPLSVQGSFFSRIDALLGGLEWEVESMLRELCSHFVGIFCWDKIFKKNFTWSNIRPMLRELCSNFVGIKYKKNFSWSNIRPVLRELCSNFVWIKYKKNFTKQYPPSAAEAMLKFCWNKLLRCFVNIWGNHYRM